MILLKKWKSIRRHAELILVGDKRIGKLMTPALITPCDTTTVVLDFNERRYESLGRDRSGSENLGRVRG